MSELRRSRYVERVREATRALLEDLLEANRRLCLAISVMGQDRDDSTHALGELGERSERWRAEQESVLTMLEAADRESKRFEEQFLEIERQNSNLASLYAAGHALHLSLEREAVLSAMQEIVINLVGSEQFAIVDASDSLVPLALFGVTSERLHGLTPRSGIIGRAGAEGRPLALPRAAPPDLTGVRVAVPLKVAENVTGFVLIFEFLPHKGELTPLDYELFALISSQAATALFAAEMFATRGATGDSIH
jgi:hypothetical protein